MIEFDKQTGGKEGLIAEVKRLCEFYKIDNVLEEIVHRDTVKRAINLKAMTEVWHETMRSRKLPERLLVAEKKRKGYFSKPKIEAKRLIYHRIGETNLKRNICFVLTFIILFEFSMICDMSGL